MKERGNERKKSEMEKSLNENYCRRLRVDLTKRSKDKGREKE